MSRESIKIKFSCDGIADVVVLPDETPILVSGYGGWTTVQRQRKVSLTQWQGKDPLRMVVPIVFDGFSDGTSQEVPISRLSRMALPPASGGEPPVVNISGISVPNPGPTDWVIESIDWGSNKIILDSSTTGVMARIRQDAVVNLLQYVAGDRIAFRDVKLGSPGTSKQGWPKAHFVRKGETLRSIAAHYYGDSTKWKKIADANGIRDGKGIKEKQLLRIPAP